METKAPKVMDDIQKCPLCKTHLVGYHTPCQCGLQWVNGPMGWHAHKQLDPQFGMFGKIGIILLFLGLIFSLVNYPISYYGDNHFMSNYMGSLDVPFIWGGMGFILVEILQAVRR